MRNVAREAHSAANTRTDDEAEAVTGHARGTYGASEAEERSGVIVSWKMIVLDEPTRKFLECLSTERKKSGLTLRKLSEAIDAPLGTVKMYELGLNYPSLAILMRLAKVLCYDLSESVNYKVYYGMLCPREIKRKLRRYGLTYTELSKLTGYPKENVYASVNQKRYGSVLCLSAVLGVLKQEEELEVLRKRV